MRAGDDAEAEGLESEESDGSDGDEDEADGTTAEMYLTGAAIRELVLEEMKEMKLVLENCVGLGTDGCVTMTGENLGE